MEYRELTPEEKATVPGLHPKAIGIGAVEDGKVVACCGIILSPHLDPLWVTPKKRGRAGFALVNLWSAVRSHLASLGATTCTASVIDGYPGPPYDRIIEHLSVALAGGEEVDARIWLLPVQDAESDTLGDETKE